MGKQHAKRHEVELVLMAIEASPWWIMSRDVQPRIEFISGVPWTMQKIGRIAEQLAIDGKIKRRRLASWKTFFEYRRLWQLDLEGGVRRRVGALDEGRRVWYEKPEPEASAEVSAPVSPRQRTLLDILRF